MGLTPLTTTDPGTTVSGIANGLIAVALLAAALFVWVAFPAPAVPSSRTAALPEPPRKRRWRWPFRRQRIPWKLGSVTVDLKGGTDTIHAVVAGMSGTGKALDVTTLVPTPTGWTTMGELQIGDFVFDEQGCPARVCSAWDVMYDRPCFEVVFSDGSTLIADEGHQWLTTSKQARNSAYQQDYKKAVRTNPNLSQQYRRTWPSVVTTAQIATSVRGRWNEANHAVALAGALQLPDAELPIDPYVLGLFLGDGTSASGNITTADAEVVVALQAAGYVTEPTTAIYGYRVAGLKDQLWQAGLITGSRKRPIGNKHIPGIYLRASFEQRLALLQGLMDTDGYCDKRGMCEFTSTSWRLAVATHELACSLGLKATIRQKPCKGRTPQSSVAYTVAFTGSIQAFRLPRKAERQRSVVRKTQNYRYIVAVRPVESVPVRCIAVEAESHLFLAGRTFIPTHNSTAVLPLLERSGMPALVVAFDNSRPIRDLFVSRGWTIWQPGGSIGWNILAGPPRVVSEALTAGFAKTDSDTGYNRGLAQMRLWTTLDALDAARAPRTLTTLVDALEAAGANPDDTRACRTWANRFRRIAKSLGPSLGTDLDLSEAMRRGESVLILPNRFLSPEDAPLIGAIALVQARRVAQEVGDFLIVVEEAGQAGQRQIEMNALAQAGRDRGCPLIVLTQNMAKLPEEVVNNVKTWVSFAQESKKELAFAADHLRIDPALLQPEHMPTGYAWVRSPDHDPKRVKLSKPRLHSTERAVNYGFRENDGAPTDASEPPVVKSRVMIREVRREPRALPTPRRNVAPEWCRHDPERLAIFQRLQNTDYTESCWLWTGDRNNSGYGRAVYLGAQRLVHRLTWGWANSVTLEEMHRLSKTNMTIDHTCQNIACANPKHLELVPNTVNVSRAWARRRERYGQSAGRR